MKTHAEQPYTFDKVVRLLISLFAVCISLFFLYTLRKVLIPFFVAWLLAYMLNPIVRFFRKRLRFSQILAVISTLFLCLSIVFLIGYILVPIVEREIWQINYLITNYEFSSLNSETTFSAADVVNRFIDFKAIREGLNKETIIEAVQQLSPALKVLFSNTMSVILGLTVFFIVALYLIFILLDYDKINELWRYLIPPKYREKVLKVASDVEANMNKYFRHQAMICLILAALYAIGFQIVGLPLAILFGVCVGLVHMIPYLQVITFPPAVLLCWLGSSQSDVSFFGMVGLTALIYVIVQLTMDLFLVPRIMGKAMGLNPAIILLSLSIWGALLGVIGMIIAIPLTTLILSYYKEFIATAEKEALENSTENNLSDNQS